MAAVDGQKYLTFNEFAYYKCVEITRRNSLESFKMDMVNLVYVFVNIEF